MTRTVKTQEERRTEILDAAQALFFGEGYGATSVNRLIEVVGISKGALYHHFKSKEEVLDCLVERLTAALVARLEAVLADERMSALDKLNAFYASSGRFKVEHAVELRELMRMTYRPENLVLHHRMTAAAARAAVPILTTILDQGVDEGVFDCQHPAWTAELIMKIGALLNEIVAELAMAAGGEPTRLTAADVARIEERMSFYGDAVTRLVGAPPGSIRIMEPGVVAAIFGVAAPSPRRSRRTRVTRQKRRKS
jgi:AcrR family transcriptional regulator